MCAKRRLLILILSFIFGFLVTSPTFAASINTAVCQKRPTVENPFSNLKSLVGLACEVPLPEKLTLFEIESRPDSSQVLYWTMATLRCLQGGGDSVLDNLGFFLKDAPIAGFKSAACIFSTQAKLALRGLDTLATGYVLIGGKVYSKLTGDEEYMADLIKANTLPSEDKLCLAEKIKSFGHLTSNFSQVVTAVREEMSQKISEYACLPPSIQTYYACHAITTLSADPVALIQGLKLGRNLLGFAKVATVRVMEEMRVGTEVLRMGEASLFRRINPSGRVVYRYQNKVTPLKGGPKVWETQELAFNAELGTLDGQSNTLLRDHVGHLIRHAQERESYLVMFDVNHLGSVNSFEDLHQAGDSYLKGILENVQSHLRESDLVYRTGGDEFTLVFEGLSKPQVQEKMNAIQTAISQDPKLQTLFKKQRDFLTAQKTQLAQAEKLESLPKEIQTRLTAEEQKLGQSNFQALKEKLTQQLTDRARITGLLEPAISPGISKIETTSTFQGVTQAADQISEAEKIKRYREKGIPRDPKK